MNLSRRQLLAGMVAAPIAAQLGPLVPDRPHVTFYKLRPVIREILGVDPAGSNDATIFATLLQDLQNNARYYVDFEVWLADHPLTPGDISGTLCADLRPNRASKCEVAGVTVGQLANM